MIRATQVRTHHHWSEAPADTVVLDFDDRHRRRMAMRGTRGLEFLLDLENATVLRNGDALVLDDGRLIEVVAAPEPLAEIRGNDPQHLARVCSRAFRASPRSTALFSFRQHVEHFFRTYGVGIWGGDFDAEAAIRTFRHGAGIQVRQD